MTVKRSVEWSGVEFQPDLTSMKKPIKLGAILHERHSDGTRELLLIGRMPRTGSRPPEFELVSSINMALASAWPENMFKDILEAQPEDIFQFLAGRWRWNLYLTDPKRLRPKSNRETLDMLGKKLFQKLVGHPFNARVRKATSSSSAQTSPSVPSVWRREELMKKRIDERVAV